MLDCKAGMGFIISLKGNFVMCIVLWAYGLTLGAVSGISLLGVDAGPSLGLRTFL